MLLKFNLTPKSRVIKNIAGIVLSFVLLYASYNCIFSIQSIVNQSESLGTTSQSIVSGVNIVSSIVMPQLVSELIGFKYALCVGEFLIMCYVVVQIYPTWFTLVPTSILSGLGGSLVWCIYGMYLTTCSRIYSKLTNTSFVRVQTFVFALSTALFFLSSVISQTLVAVILKTETNSTNDETTTVAPPTYFYNHRETFDFENKCGKNNCPRTELPRSLAKTTQTSFTIFYVILVIIGFLSMLATFFLMDNFEDMDEPTPKRPKITRQLVSQRFKNEFRNLIKLSKNIDIWLVCPITLYSAFEQTLIWNEFNRAFAVCLLGINYVGWTNILLGVLSSVLCLSNGYVLKHIGLKTGIVFMIVVSAAIDVFILSWTPSQDEKPAVFLLVVGFSLTQSISRAHGIGLYGIYFPNNHTAYSVYSLAATTGLFIGSLLSSYVCVKIKSYVHFGLVVWCLISFMVLEVKNERKKLKVAAMSVQEEETNKLEL